jgi:hypothetical protein
MPGVDGSFFIFKDLTFGAEGHLNGVKSMREEVSGMKVDRFPGQSYGSGGKAGQEKIQFLSNAPSSIDDR